MSASIAVTPSGAGYSIEFDGRRTQYIPRTDSVAVHIVMMAIAQSPRPVTPANARDALRLSVDALPAFQRRWKSRIAAAFERPCRALADELRERLTLGTEFAAFDYDGALALPVRVVARNLFVPKVRRRPAGVIVSPTLPEAEVMGTVVALRRDAFAGVVLDWRGNPWLLQVAPAGYVAGVIAVRGTDGAYTWEARAYFSDGYVVPGTGAYAPGAGRCVGFFGSLNSHLVEMAEQVDERRLPKRGAHRLLADTLSHARRRGKFTS